MLLNTVFFSLVLIIYLEQRYFKIVQLILLQLSLPLSQ